MVHEYAGGAVLFTVREEEWFFVLVEETDGHCGFPKGHLEKDESEKEAALREIREETGIVAALVDGFREEAVYPKGDAVMKHVTYFLAEYQGQAAECGDEIGAVYLLPFAEAYEKLTYESSKSILAKAHKCLLQPQISCS